MAQPALQARGSWKIWLEFINQAASVPLIWPKEGAQRSLECSALRSSGPRVNNSHINYRMIKDSLRRLMIQMKYVWSLTSNLNNTIKLE